MADLTPEALAYLGILRALAPHEISAWRHGLECAELTTRGTELAARGRASQRAFRDNTNSPGGGRPRDLSAHGTRNF